MDIRDRELKLCELTFIYPEYDGKDGHLVVSNISGASVVVDSWMREFLENLGKTSRVADITDPELLENLQKMYEANLIIDRTSDGLILMRETIEACKKRNELNIMPVVTMACNMACPYCFEKKNNEFMDSAMLEKIIRYTTGRMDAEGITNIYSSLFGGEPLLNFKICQQWVERMSEEVARRQGVFKIALITNGALLTPKIIQFLKDYNVFYIQITIDGPKAIHDRRRYFNNGQGSYDVLMEKLALVADSGLNLQLRINVDNENHPHIPELIEDFTRRGLNKSNVYLSLERVMTNTDSNSSYCSQCIPINHYDETILPYVLNLRQRGFKVQFGRTNPLRPIFCNAYAGKHIAITPAGDLYSCLDGVGDPRYMVGNLTQDPIYNEKFAQWNAVSAMEFAKCRECKVIGFCGAGCGAEAINKYGSLAHEPVCPPLKWSYVGGVVLPTSVLEHL